jgi:hypothetical protein
VEEFSAGCWRHGVELSLQLSLELIATHRSQDRVLLAAISTRRRREDSCEGTG